MIAQLGNVDCSAIILLVGRLVEAQHFLPDVCSTEIQKGVTKLLFDGQQAVVKTLGN